MEMDFQKATEANEPELKRLIQDSVLELLKTDYSESQISLSVGAVFAVPSRLIAAGTFSVGVHNGDIVACGGWSPPHPAARHSPQKGIARAARLHAFFVSPRFARQGIARRLLALCEAEILSAEIPSVAMFSTLTAAPFYRSCGYRETGQTELPLTETQSFPVTIMQKEF